jgi:hypothetical protein
VVKLRDNLTHTLGLECDDVNDVLLLKAFDYRTVVKI